MGLRDVSRWTVPDYNMGDVRSFSSIIFLRVMSGNEVVGYIFVIDRKFGERAKHKMPGGHGKPGETPYEAAVRELLGEAGVTATNILMADHWKEGHGERCHWKFLFQGDVSESRSMDLHPKNDENEGEDAEFFTVQEFENLVRKNKFLNSHYTLLTYTNLIEPILLPADT